MTVADLTPERLQELHDTYRELHQHPELSMQEHWTAEQIESRLDALGIEHFRCGGTGVVGILRHDDGPVVAFRADTDGLPIQEDTGLPFSSAEKGTLEDGTEVPVMHGCGHDAHVACLLTAARVLAETPGTWKGTAVLIFQPGEETAAGSQAMVDDGLWDRAPRPELVMGQHVMPGVAGTVKLLSGPTMSYADSWKVTLTGKQAHGSQPEFSIDPIVLGANIVTRLQGVVARELPPLKSAVVTVGTFHAGLKENIIPATAELKLNIRSLDDDARAVVLPAVKRIIMAEAQASGAPEPVIEEIYRFPANFNDPESVASVRPALVEALGSEEAVYDGQPYLGSEDFGTLGQSIDVPTVYWFFGGHTREQMEAGGVPSNHSPQFAPVAEGTLEGGASAAIAALRARLQR